MYESSNSLKSCKFWDDQLLGALKSEGLSCKVRNLASTDNLPDLLLTAHDFFTPQPVKDASVFHLHNVIHDWPDKYCLQILRHFRNAAALDTRLVIADGLVSYACKEDSLTDIPGAERPIPPKPLLPNMSHVATASYHVDIQVQPLRSYTTEHPGELMHLADDGACQRQGALTQADERAYGTDWLESRASSPSACFQHMQDHRSSCLRAFSRIQNGHAARI